MLLNKLINIHAAKWLILVHTSLKYQFNSRMICFFNWEFVLNYLVVLVYVRAHLLMTDTNC